MVLCYGLLSAAVADGLGEVEVFAWLVLYALGGGGGRGGGHYHIINNFSRPKTQNFRRKLFQQLSTDGNLLIIIITIMITITTMGIYTTLSATQSALQIKCGIHLKRRRSNTAREKSMI